MRYLAFLACLSAAGASAHGPDAYCDYMESRIDGYLGVVLGTEPLRESLMERISNLHSGHEDFSVVNDALEVAGRRLRANETQMHKTALEYAQVCGHESLHSRGIVAAVAKWFEGTRLAELAP